MTLLVLVTGAALLIYLGAPKLRDYAVGWFNETMAAAEKEAAFQQRWEPPAEDDPNGWFPQSISGYSADRTELSDAPAGFHDVRRSRSATYAAGAQKIEVFVYRATSLEREALIRRLQDAEQGGTVTRMTSGDDNYYERRNGTSHLHVRWLKGTLFVFRSTTSDPRPFAAEYLRAISSAPVVEPVPPATPLEAEPENSGGD